MSEVGTLRIVSIIENWDMRGVHKLRTGREATALSRGQCLVAFNKAMTIGRIVDVAGGIHTYYTEPKEIFDIDSLSARVTRGFWVALRVGKATQQAARKLRRVA